MTTPLRTERAGRTWTFTLDAPGRRNALSASLVDALLAGVAQAHKEGANVLVFRGTGRNFSAGFDFTDFQTQSEGDLLLRFVRIEQLLQAVANSPCVTLAFAHGKNFGAGVDLFAACRLRVASADATFRMPGMQFGLVLGTRRLGALVGSAVARRILENSETVDSDEGLKNGLITHMVAPDSENPDFDAVATAEALATRLDVETRTALYRILSRDSDHEDMALLVRSAAHPDLKARIARYLTAG